MRVFRKIKVAQSAKKGNIFTLFFFLAALIFPFSVGKCDENVLANDASYTENTIDLIKTNLNDFNKKVAWLEDIELQSVPLFYAFYQKNGFAPVWTIGNKLTSQSEVLINMFRDSYKYGFEPSNFNIKELELYSHLLMTEKQVKKSADLRARFEFLMTNSVFTFMLYLKHGTQYSGTEEVFINGDSIISSFPAYLIRVLPSENLKDEILKFQPDNPQYAALQHEMEMIVTNLDLSENNAEQRTFKNDTTSLCDLFSYLFTGKLNTTGTIGYPDPKQFTSMLIEFQNGVGIRPSGKIDSPTLKMVTNVFRSRYSEIATELEMIRTGKKVNLTSITLNHWKEMVF
jgi:murein L,D-transpeptidase YcbB/YkuD